ncbi:Rne/Rng family ribonuclease [Robertmurraya massiliosenegalensis]|uniref:Rne/Rng family ribonuclease n=1 Tax=Robertmurraya massiliosenegalensis TaxID=1287657 RepID=UPI00031EEE26|nr:Rne/Rng family ribonuclease [Robertmurraya massiliosenegalensis]
MNVLVVNGIGKEKRYALIKKQKVEKLVIEQPQQQSIVGSIYLGIVEKVLPGMNAAFINIGLEKNGFLHRDKLPAFFVSQEDKGISSYLHQGEKILVQVEKDATGDKGPRVTGMIELGGDMTVYTPQGEFVAVSKKIDETVREEWRQLGNEFKRRDEGILFRTVCVERTKEEVLAELEQLRVKYATMIQTVKSMKKPGLVISRNFFLEEVKGVISKLDSGRVVVDTLEMKKELEAVCHHVELVYQQEKEDVFSLYRLEYEIENALKKVVWLENGAYLVFDETEALTVIDVNTGQFSGKHHLQDTVMKTNLLAATEIARQIRLRGLAGMILVDFIDMKEQKIREQVRRKLEVALQEDERRTRVVGFTPLGILQMTRMKTRVSLSETLMSTCQVCAGYGKVLSAETLSFRLERELLALRGKDFEAVLIEATADVKDIFTGENGSQQKLIEEICGMELYFSIEEGAKPSYRIKQMGTKADIGRGNSY